MKLIIPPRHQRVKNSQLSVCVAWSPDDIDGRAYNAVGLAEASDLLYVMLCTYLPTHLPTHPPT